MTLLFLNFRFQVLCLCSVLIANQAHCLLRKRTCIYGLFVPSFAGGSESSWDKDKLQSPITTGSQHSIGHPTLSGQTGLGSAHPLSPLQQNHLLTNSMYCALTGKEKCLEPCLEPGLVLLPSLLEMRKWTGSGLLLPLHLCSISRLPPGTQPSSLSSHPVLG